MAIPTVIYALVVDDDPLILRHACDIPEGAGSHFHQAGTGEEAKAFLGDEADGVTLMFSDVAMPGDSDGFARTHYVAEYWPWIEIVLTSGNVTPCPWDMPDKATCIGKPFRRSHAPATSHGEAAGQQATRTAQARGVAASS